MDQFFYDDWQTLVRTLVVGALAEGALAFALLIGLQFVVTWSSVRAR